MHSLRNAAEVINESAKARYKSASDGLKKSINEGEIKEESIAEAHLILAYL